MGRTHRSKAPRTSTFPSRGSHDMQATCSPKGVSVSVLSKTPAKENPCHLNSAFEKLLHYAQCILPPFFVSPISWRFCTASLTASSSGLSNTWDKKSTALKQNTHIQNIHHSSTEQSEHLWKNHFCSTLQLGLWILACTTRLSNGVRRISGMGKGVMDSSCLRGKRW